MKEDQVHMETWKQGTELNTCINLQNTQYAMISNTLDIPEIPQ